jgi:hypothetical protein
MVVLRQKGVLHCCNYYWCNVKRYTPSMLRKFLFRDNYGVYSVTAILRNSYYYYDGKIKL